MSVESAPDDDALAAALRQFINAPTARIAAGVFSDNRTLLTSPEAKQIFTASLEGNAGDSRATMVLQARWNLLDRLARDGPEQALAAYDSIIESVLAVLAVPRDGRAVIDANLADLTRPEVDWVFADLLCQPRSDEEIEEILERRERLREWRNTLGGIVPDTGA
jgi:hypothetical protein